MGGNREGREGSWRGEGVVDGRTRVKTYCYQLSIPTFRHGLFLVRYGLVGAEVPGYSVAVIVFYNNNNSYKALLSNQR